MVPSKAEPRAENADQGSGDQVEAEVIELHEARRADINRHRYRDESDDDEVVGRRSGLVAYGCVVGEVVGSFFLLYGLLVDRLSASIGTMERE